MSHTPPYFIGVDVGTQGCRVALIDSVGIKVASASKEFPLSTDSMQEQSPEMWWQSCLQLLMKMSSDVKDLIHREEIMAFSVTSTSGTVIPIDRQFQSLHPAIMYSDKRSVIEADFCRAEARHAAIGGYTGFNSSSGLPKMLWFIKNFPDKAERIYKWIHAADFIIGKLSDEWAITDYTNVLKSGYDLDKREWADYLFNKLGLLREWMPEVVASGQKIGRLSPAVAMQLGMNQDVSVVTGMTDGCASQIASGAAMPGDWNTTIGTTLVVKGITRKEVNDPSGSLYNHLHPQGFRMPGGASNIGADWIAKDFGNDLTVVEKEAAEIIPTGMFSYPLNGKGERFPFIAPEAVGFEPPDLSPSQHFASKMEGVAYVERYAYEMIRKLSRENITAVYAAGGGSNSDTWLKIRSNVLRLPIYKMKHITGAVGAAILAASQTHFSSLTEATKAISQLEKEIYPDEKLADKYQEYYADFLEILKERGYL